MTGTLGEENGKAVGWDERRLVCLARGLRGISSTVRDGYGGTGTGSGAGAGAGGSGWSEETEDKSLSSLSLIHI